MSDHSKIEWTDATWSPSVGCAKVSPGCDNCYAIRTAARFQGSPAYAGTVARGQSGLDWTGVVNTLPDRLDAPLHWREPRRIFVNSMSDLFHDSVPDEFIARVFAVMSQAPQHTFQVLTKRHGRMRSLLTSLHFRSDAHSRAIDLVQNRRVQHGFHWPLPNVWLGVSVESQQWADIRIPALLDTPAAVRWISAEPLLGPVLLLDDDHRGHEREWHGSFFACLDCSTENDLVEYHEQAIGLDWVVAGGESGPGARPAHPEWFRQLRDQCTSAGVPFFFKQWGEWAPAAWHGEDGGTHAFTGTLGAGDAPHFMQIGHGPTSGERDLTTPRGAQGMRKVGKKSAGRELDGRTWDEYPQAVTG